MAASAAAIQSGIQRVNNSVTITDDLRNKALALAFANKEVCETLISLAGMLDIVERLIGGSIDDQNLHENLTYAVRGCKMLATYGISETAMEVDDFLQSLSRGELA